MSFPSGVHWARAACCSIGRWVFPSKKNTSSRTRSASRNPSSTSPNSSDTSLWMLWPSPYSWIREVPSRSAASIDMSESSGSYSTSISRAAVSAVSSSTAATAATGSPTKRTFSTQSGSSSWVTGMIPKRTGRKSWPVITA